MNNKFEKMNKYMILGRKNRCNAKVRLANEENYIEISTGMKRGSLESGYLRGMSSAIFDLIGDYPEIYLEGEEVLEDLEYITSNFVIDYKGDIFHGLEKDFTLILGLGLGRSIKVDNNLCEPISSLRTTKKFKDLNRYKHEPKILDEIDESKYERRKTYRQNKIDSEESELVGFESTNGKYVRFIKKVPKIWKFLKEVSDKEGIIVNKVYLDSKNKGYLDLNKGSKNIIFETHPSFALSYCFDKPVDIYGKTE